jgi:hypothetical protein
MNEKQKDNLAKAAAACAATIGEDLKPDEKPQVQFFHGLAWMLAHLLKSPRLLLGAAKQAEAYLPGETAEGVPT